MSDFASQYSLWGIDDGKETVKLNKSTASARPPSGGGAANGGTGECVENMEEVLRSRTPGGATHRRWWSSTVRRCGGDVEDAWVALADGDVVDASADDE
jgi:hypothetical protein